MIPIYKPYIPEKSVEYATDAIKSSWISSIGKYIEAATDRLQTIMGCKYVILLNNGTSATHLVTKALKIQHPEIKRVLVPSACYITAYNSLVYDGVDQWDVSCVDLNPETWNMDTQSVDEGDAIFAVHNFGNIINIPELKRRFNCPVIEDNCEGFFGMHEGVSSGTESLCSSMSFFGNKNITCGEGGAFMTNDESIFKYMSKVRGQGQTERRYVHDVLGYNFRMTNVQAALLLGQIEELEHIKSNKTRVFERYRKNLTGVDGVFLQQQTPNTEHSMWMFGVRFSGLTNYEQANNFFADAGIETRPMFYPYSVHPHLNFRGEDCVATKLNQSIVIFPSFPELNNIDIDMICDRIVAFSSTIKH